MTPTPTKVFVGMNTPFPADKLELTVIKAWVTDKGVTVMIPKIRFNFIEPEYVYMLVRVKVSGLDGATTGMEFIRRDLFVQFAEKEAVNCLAIIVGTIDKTRAIVTGLIPEKKTRILPESFAGLSEEGVADYLFSLPYEPDPQDLVYLYWGEYPPVKIILTEDD